MSDQARAAKDVIERIDNGVREVWVDGAGWITMPPQRTYRPEDFCLAQHPVHKTWRCLLLAGHEGSHR